MSFLISTRNPIVLVLFVSVLLVSGCSGSGANESSSSEGSVSASNDTNSTPADDMSNSATDSTAEVNDGAAQQTTDDTNSIDGIDMTQTETQPDQEMPVNLPQNQPDSVVAVPDPLVQNLTEVSFDITVPAYMSDALQVRVIWGDIDITAAWVGDESWSVNQALPTNTEHQLLVTFYDDNGETELGSFEQTYKTGTNASESFIISADQFDTERFDSDGDGISNINDSFDGADSSTAPRILLFSETKDFRHDSTEVALVALQELATSAGMQTDNAGDSSGVFTDANLANYAAVVWVMTSGDVLDASEQAAFERYIRAGGGYAGIHAASFTEYEWPWYGALVGAYFDSHPDIQSATQNVEDGSHPSTAHLNLTWTRTDEWYNYRSNPRARVNVLLSLDEDTYSGGTMNGDHPNAWYHEYDGGRSWYTGGGHTESSYSEPEFRTHLLGGLRYAAGHSG